MPSRASILMKMHHYYEYRIKHEGLPGPDIIKEQIAEIGHKRIISIVFLNHANGNTYISIRTGQISRKYPKKIVLHGFPMGNSISIPNGDIIDIIESIFLHDDSWPYPKRFFYDSE